MDDKVYYLEPAQQRYHTRIDCSVLLEQADIELVIVKARPKVRPCALCGYDEPSGGSEEGVVRSDSPCD